MSEPIVTIDYRETQVSSLDYTRAEVIDALGRATGIDCSTLSDEQLVEKVSTELATPHQSNLPGEFESDHDSCGSIADREWSVTAL